MWLKNLKFHPKGHIFISLSEQSEVNVHKLVIVLANLSLFSFQRHLYKTSKNSVHRLRLRLPCKFIIRALGKIFTVYCSCNLPRWTISNNPHWEHRIRT